MLHRLIRVITFLLVPLFFLFVLNNLPITASLWLDETISAWLITLPDEDFYATTLRFQATSPFYFILLREWASFFGNEAGALRSFSLLLFLLSTFTLLLISKQLKIPQAVTWVPLIIIGTEEILQAAVSARPYMLALFGTISSTYLFLSWYRQATYRRAFLYGASLLLTFYAHYLFIGIVAIHLLFLLLKDRTLLASRILGFSTILSVVIFLSIPGLAHIFWWASRETQILPAPSWSLTGILRLFIPPALAVYTVASLMLAWSFKGTTGSLKLSRATLLPLIAWWLIPGVIAILLSVFVGGSFLLIRYTLWTVGGISLLLALVMGKVLQPRSVPLAVFTWLCLAFSLESSRRWHIEDWRAAAQDLVAQKTPSTLLFSGLLEANSPLFLEDETAFSYLTAPFKVYAPAVRSLPVPSQLEKKELMSIFTERVARLSKEHAVVPLVFLTNRSHSRKQVFVEALGKLGYEVQSTREYNLIHVLIARKIVK